MLSLAVTVSDQSQFIVFSTSDVMKIADVLKAGDDEDADDDCGCVSSSRSILPCFYLPCTSRRAFSKLKGKQGGKEERRKRKNEEAFDSVEVSACGDDDGLMQKSKLVTSSTSNSASEIVDYSGQHIRDVSFNLGVAVGLAFLTATSKNEFNKMMELRTEMETLLREVKDEIQRKDEIFEPSESSDICVSSTTSYMEVEIMNDHSTTMSCAPSHTLEATKITTEGDSYLRCDTPGKEDCIPGIDKLEAEVEAELERLQLRLDVEEFSEHLQQQLSEKEQIVKNIAHEESLANCLGEIEDPDGWEQENGVCPNELERRLQELLEEREQAQTDGIISTIECSSFGETDDLQIRKGGQQSSGVSPCILERKLQELLEARQQDRIEELESALEHVKRKLRQKEMEVSWWKDIAELISQHVTDAIQLSR